MKAFHYNINEEGEVTEFVGSVMKKIPDRPDLLAPFVYWLPPLVKEVWMVDAKAVHPGVFTELSHLEHLYLENANITLAEGCLPDRLVTLHVPYDKNCGEILKDYVRCANGFRKPGFCSMLWHAMNGKAKLDLILTDDCCNAREFNCPITFDITIHGNISKPFVFDGAEICTIKITENCDYINPMTFQAESAPDIYSPRIKYFEVDASNKKYISIDGVLFVKESSTLLRVPTDKFTDDPNGVYVVPDFVKHIAEGAFEGVFGCEEVHLPWHLIEYSESFTKTFGTRKIVLKTNE